MNMIMKNSFITKIVIPATLIGIGSIGHIEAQNISWTGGSGTGLDWADTDNWSSDALPTDDNIILWGASSDITSSINVSEGSLSAGQRIYGNTNITLVLEDAETPALTAGLIQVGYSRAGAASLTLTGSGTLNVTAIHAGSSGNDSLIVDGVTITRIGASISQVGRTGFNNTATFQNGATVNLSSMNIGYDGGVGNNKLIVTGANTTFLLDDGSSNRGFYISSGSTTAATAQERYDGALQNNHAFIQAGGKMTISTDGTANNRLHLGTGTNAHSNTVVVEGTNSQLILAKGTSSGIGTIVSIGNSDNLSLGGNALIVKDGGSLVSTLDHSGSISIYGFNENEGINAGDNKLVIGPNGSALLNGAVNATGGVLQIDSSATFSSASVTVSANGRMEAAGTNFSTTGNTTIQDTGTLAIGGPDADSADILTLSSNMIFQSGATLELTIFDADNISHISLLEEGSLSINNNATLQLLLHDGYTISGGETWTLFTGATENISGNFNMSILELPTLTGSLEWDISQLNEAGGWQVSVIPEPTSAILLLLSAGGGLTFSRRSSRKLY